ncbi:MAG: galactose oxidase-like domain-containing protein, partial [Actinomycetota bacterium]
MACVATIALLGPLAAAPAAAQTTSDAATSGEWSAVADWNFIPIHSYVNDDGKLVTYGGSRTGGQGGFEYDIWDPTKGFGADAHTTLDNSLGTNVFCSTSVTDPEGNGALIIGGQTRGSAVNTFTARLDGTTLQSFDSMQNPRWYATATTLWDGRILVQGGIPNGFGGRNTPITVAEIYEPDTGWRNLEGTRSTDLWDTANYGWWYPKAHLAPNGKIWGLAWDQMYYIDPEGDGAIEPLGTLPTDNRGATSASVMYDTGLLLQVGGGERGSNESRYRGSTKATIVDLNQDPPALRPTGDMAFGRHQADAIVLPDGKVLVVGGSLENNTMDGVAYAPELWDPATDTWTTLAAGEKARLYHSTAALLPDGSVFAGGGGAPGPQRNLNAEVFYPPYLFAADGSRAAQPTLGGAPSGVNYGQSFSATVSESIDRVTFIKVNSATHTINTQIFQELDFTQSGNTLSITAPGNNKVATPGLYMLYALDADGVPSEAQMVWLTNDDTPEPPPTTTTTTTTSAPTTTTTTEAPPAEPSDNLLTNGSFEQEFVTDGRWAFRTIPGWTTTRTGNTFELWGNGHNGVTSAQGRQHGELNGDEPDTITQTVT